MNAFEYTIQRCFDVPEFVEYFTANSNSNSIKTVSYAFDYDEAYTEFGSDNGVSFYLTCKVKDYTPRKGDIIRFRKKRYRVDTFSADAFNLTYNIYLRSLTTKI